MPEERIVTLARLQSGQRGRVAEIQGGHVLINRLNAMGIRPGMRITKVSSMFMRGPVTVQVGQTQLAIGYGMARKIMIVPDGTSP